MEPLLTLAQTTRFFPGRGPTGYVAKNTILEYTNKGVRVGTQTIKLQAVHSPSGRRWTERAVAEFIAAITAAKEAQSRKKAPVSSARAALIAKGVLKPDPSPTRARGMSRDGHSVPLRTSATQAENR